MRDRSSEWWPALAIFLLALVGSRCVPDALADGTREEAPDRSEPRAVYTVDLSWIERTNGVLGASWVEYSRDMATWTPIRHTFRAIRDGDAIESLYLPAGIYAFRVRVYTFAGFVTSLDTLIGAITPDGNLMHGRESLHWELEQKR